jgi:serine/threonine protein phosphatase PrpC
VISDGLFNELTDEEIETALAANEVVTEIVDSLIDGAVARGVVTIFPL